MPYRRTLKLAVRVLPPSSAWQPLRGRPPTTSLWDPTPPSIRRRSPSMSATRWSGRTPGGPTMFTRMTGASATRSRPTPGRSPVPSPRRVRWATTVKCMAVRALACSARSPSRAPEAAGQAGTLRFSLASYSVGEGGGSATVAVQRINGDDGAVSVQYSAAAGTATAGQDFTAVSGTLNWADNDDSPRDFSVPVLNDATDESNETVLLTLSNPTGGAALDGNLKNSTLTIHDDDPARRRERGLPHHPGLPGLPLPRAHLPELGRVHPGPQGGRLPPRDALRERCRGRPFGGIRAHHRPASQWLPLAHDRPLHPLARGGGDPADQHADHQRATSWPPCRRIPTILSGLQDRTGFLP